MTKSVESLRRALSLDPSDCRTWYELSTEALRLNDPSVVLGVGRPEGALVIPGSLPARGRLDRETQMFWASLISRRLEDHEDVYLVDHPHMVGWMYSSFHPRTGLHHNDNGPSWVMVLADGLIKVEYRRYGRLHRTGRPAISLYSSTETWDEYWEDGGFLRRDW